MLFLFHFFRFAVYIYIYTHTFDESTLLPKLFSQLLSRILGKICFDRLSHVDISTVYPVFGHNFSFQLKRIESRYN